jgi:hypothetical protein
MSRLGRDLGSRMRSVAGRPNEPTGARLGDLRRRFGRRTPERGLADRLPKGPSAVARVPAHAPISQAGVRTRRRSTRRHLEDPVVPKRELIDQTNSKRYARRDARGRFTTDQVEVGRSLTADRRRKAKTVAPKGQGDRGDQRQR